MSNIEPVVRVSCVIPTHGRDSYLEKAIRSAASQSYAPVEILVVDDLGSSATRSLVEGVSSGLDSSGLDIRYLDASNEPIKSAGASRNLGARYARGSHIAFLDDDDLWLPDFLEGCVRLLVHDCLDLVVSWISLVQGEKVAPGHTMLANLAAGDAYAKNPGLTGSNFLISAAVYQELEGFDATLWVSNDRDFLIRFLILGRPFGVLERRSVLQRVHNEGQLTNRTEKRARGLEAFRAKHIDRISRRDRRYLAREIYSVRRVCARRFTKRCTYLVRQTLTYSLPELVVVIIKRLTNRTPSYT